MEDEKKFKYAVETPVPVVVNHMQTIHTIRSVLKQEVGVDCEAIIQSYWFPVFVSAEILVTKTNYCDVDDGQSTFTETDRVSDLSCQRIFMSDAFSLPFDLAAFFARGGVWEICEDVPTWNFWQKFVFLTELSHDIGQTICIPTIRSHRFSNDGLIVRSRFDILLDSQLLHFLPKGMKFDRRRHLECCLSECPPHLAHPLVNPDGKQKDGDGEENEAEDEDDQEVQYDHEHFENRSGSDRTYAVMNFTVVAD